MPPLPSPDPAAGLAAPPAETGVKPPLWTGTFFTFLFINFCAFMGFNMLLPTLPLYLEGNGLSEREIGLVFGSFTLSAITARLTASRIAARLGSVQTARLGLFVCSGGTLFYFLYTAIPSYVAARLLQGLGFGLTSTLLVSLASQTIPPSRMGEGLGYLGLGATVALAIGPYSGLFAAERYGYVVMFLSVSLCCLAAGAVSLALPKIPFHRSRAACRKAGPEAAPEAAPDFRNAPAAPEAPGPSATPAAASAASAAPEPPAVPEASALPEASAAPETAAGDAPPGAPAPGPRAAGFFRSVSSRLERAALPPSLLMFVYGIAVSGLTAFLAVYATERGMPSAAEFFVVSTVGTVVSRLWAGRIYDRKGHFFVIPPAAAAVIFSLVSILSVPGRALMDISAVLYGLGAGAIFPSLQTLALTSVPSERRTVASAYFFVAFDFGMGIGAVIMGALAGLFSTYRVVFVGSLIFMGLFSAFYFALFRGGGPRGPESPRPESPAPGPARRGEGAPPPPPPPNAPPPAAQ
ncbi:MAG: MFS transporter, partial [Deltaproteobacteria bacterium]|nr:MFS transporter [Deltaproteobacteria bacterium]